MILRFSVARVCDFLVVAPRRAEFRILILLTHFHRPFLHPGKFAGLEVVHRAVFRLVSLHRLERMFACKSPFVVSMILSPLFPFSV